MKIIRHTPDRLVIARTPWQPGAAIAAAGLALGLLLWLAGDPRTALAVLALALIGALAATVLARVQVDLDARSNAVILWRRNGLRRAALRQALSDLSCAVAEQSDDPNPRYATTMVFDRGLGAGRYPLGAQAAPLAELTDTINLWLHAARRRA